MQSSFETCSGAPAASKNTAGLPDTTTVTRPTSSRVGCPAEVPALASNPWAQRSHNAAGTNTSNLCSRVVPRLCRSRGGNCPTLRARPPRRARSTRGYWSCLRRDRSDALIKPQGPGDTKNKKPPCNNTWWTEIKRTVQSPPLCLHRERRLRHSPTVVTGSSMDHHCAETKKGKCLVYGVQQAQTAPRRKARRADEATAIAISPRPPERPGAHAKFRVSQ